MFGTELLAAPFVVPRGFTDTGLSRQLIWLPELGDWYDISGQYYAGKRWIVLYGALDEIPLFARAGGILPLGPKVDWGGIENPQTLYVHIYPGADNEFVLYEDDGVSQAYRDGKYALTTFSQVWDEQQQSFVIHPAKGEINLIPDKRSYTPFFHAIQNPGSVVVLVNGEIINADIDYDEAQHAFKIMSIQISPEDTLRDD